MEEAGSGWAADTAALWGCASPGGGSGGISGAETLARSMRLPMRPARRTLGFYKPIPTHGHPVGQVPTAESAAMRREAGHVAPEGGQVPPAEPPSVRAPSPCWMQPKQQRTCEGQGSDDGNEGRAGGGRRTPPSRSSSHPPSRLTAHEESPHEDDEDEDVAPKGGGERHVRVHASDARATSEAVAVAACRNVAPEPELAMPMASLDADDDVFEIE